MDFIPYDGKINKKYGYQLTKKGEKMKNKMTKLITLLLSGVMTLACIGAAGCNKDGDGGTNPDGETLSAYKSGSDSAFELRIFNFHAGYGSDWMEDAAKAFVKANKTTDFGNGHIGCDISLTKMQKTQGIGFINTGYHIATGLPDFIAMARAGEVMDLTETLTEDLGNGEGTIKEKIRPEMLNMLTLDNKTYGVPLVNTLYGFSYAMDAFEEEDLYLCANPSQGSVHSCEYGTAYFINEGCKDKSAGPDGKSGTYDDGLPANMQEFLVLCDYMKDVKDMDAVSFAGSLTAEYAYCGVLGLWAGLAGKEQMQTVYSLDGTIDVITGFTDEPLFPNAQLPSVQELKVPTYESVKIDNSNGYLVQSMVSKYYAQAIFQVMVQEGYIETYTPTTSHYQAQEIFILGDTLGGKKVGMHLDNGSFWWQEAKLRGTFDKLYKYSDKYSAENPKPVAFMAHPSSYEYEYEADGNTIKKDADGNYVMKAVTEANAKQRGVISSGLHGIYANARYKDDETAKLVIKKFIQSMCTDEMNKNFFLRSCILKNGLFVEYTEEEKAGMNTYAQSILNATGNTLDNTVLAGSTNSKVCANFPAFTLVSGRHTSPIRKDNQSYPIYSGYKLGEINAVEAFNYLKMDKAQYDTLMAN